MTPAIQTARLSFRAFTVEDFDAVHVCGLMRSDPNGPQYGFGYVLHKDWWGQGLASEATAALIKFGFGE